MTEIDELRAAIDPLIEQVEAATRPACHCAACMAAAGLARTSLAYLSPLGAELLADVPHDEAFFVRLAEHMREEIKRLSRTLRQVTALSCGPNRSQPMSETPVQRFQGRRARGEMLKNPKIPGTFILR